MHPSSRALIAIGAVVVLAAAVTAGFTLGRGGRAHAVTSTGKPASSPTTTGAAATKRSGTTKSASFTATTASPPQVPAPAGLPALECPVATVAVHDSRGLQAALGAARPGTVIHLDDGVYHGRFVGTGAGTPAQPIWVCGGPMAILDDSQQPKDSAPPQGSGSYGFHLLEASWWNLVGFSLRNGQKGVMLDHSDYNTLYGLTVYNIGDEAIHLREFSSHNTVEGCVIRDTGLRVAKYGEGIYLGTAVHNWPTYTGGQPDASDANKVLYNNIASTTAENIDVKEGTSGGELAFNQLDGNGLVASAATSWVNVKGNDYSVHDNTGQNSYENGFSTHKIVAGSGEGNVFSHNHVGAGVVGYGYDFDSKPNTFLCNNTGGGARGRSNRTCTG